VHAPVDYAALRSPATPEEIAELEARLGFPLHPQLRALLEHIADRHQWLIDVGAETPGATDHRKSARKSGQSNPPRTRGWTTADTRGTEKVPTVPADVGMIRHEGELLKVSVAQSVSVRGLPAFVHDLLQLETDLAACGEPMLRLYVRPVL
jgi:hypothetical protein